MVLFDLTSALPVSRCDAIDFLHFTLRCWAHCPIKSLNLWSMTDVPVCLLLFFFPQPQRKEKYCPIGLFLIHIEKVAAIAAVWLPVVRWTRTLFSVSSRARRLLGGWLPSAELIELCTQDARITPTGPTHAWIRDAGHEEVKERNCVNQAHPSSLPGETARAASSLCPLIYSQVYKYSSSSSPLSLERRCATCVGFCGGSGSDQYSQKCLEPVKPPVLAFSLSFSRR